MVSKKNHLTNWLKSFNAAEKPDDTEQADQSLESSTPEHDLDDIKKKSSYHENSSLTVEAEKESVNTIIHDIRYIPRTNIIFPKNDKNRSCHIEWFRTYKWLHYDLEQDKIFCFECMKAVKNNLVTSYQENAFITFGVNNWKKAVEKCNKHQISHSHIQAIFQNNQLNKNRNIINLINNQAYQQRKDALEALKVIFSSINYLARCGVALQGHASESGNLMELLRERSKFLPKLHDWLTKKNNWLSHDIQNEIISLMANKILRDIADEVRNSTFFSIMADGTTDSAGNEQFSICLRYVSVEDLKIHEKFIGLYNAPDSTSNTLFKVIVDVCLRLNLDLNKLRGHCFDGAANMSGRLNGLKQKICDKYPKSIYIHCSNHALDLSLQEIARKSDLINDALGTVKDVSNIILESFKRKTMYDKVLPVNTNGPGQNKSYKLLPLCPTRWAVRVKSIERFLTNLKRVQATVKELLDAPGCIRDDCRSILKGYNKRSHRFETVCALHFSKLIFSPCEELASVLQSPNFTVLGAQNAADYLIESINSFRTEETFNEIWDSVEKASQGLELNSPEIKRRRKIPRKIEFLNESTSESVQLDSKSNMRKSFYETIDCLVTEIQRRFRQEGVTRLINLENIILESAKGKTFSLDKLSDFLGINSSDFNLSDLQTQLTFLPKIIKNKLAATPPKDFKNSAAEKKIKKSVFKLGKSKITVQNIMEILKEELETVREMISEVIRLIILISTVPATSVCAERSFSALRRLLTYLRSTMTQSRITHLLLLNVYKAEAENLPINTLIKDFIGQNCERAKVFLVPE